MTFDPAQNWFTAQGIPVIPYDVGPKSYLPQMRLIARDAGNNIWRRAISYCPLSTFWARTRSSRQSGFLSNEGFLFLPLSR